MNTAIYAASFDPITYGHINIIDRSLNIFDELIVVIANNPTKKYLFNLSERYNIVKKVLNNYGDKIKVYSHEGLLVDFAYAHNIKTIIRGVRGSSDVDYEQILNDINRSQNSGIDTIILFADQKLSHISSSAVKELQKYHANNILEYVPMIVKKELEIKISNQKFIGITGEIGAGKSYIINSFINIATKNNIKIKSINFDELGHYILEEGNEPIFVDIRNQLIDKFGKDIINSTVNNFINRKKLGSKLWNNKIDLDWFNKLIKNGLLYLYRQQLNNFEGLIIVEGALLAEADMTYLVNNNILIIEDTKENRIERLKKRNYTDDEIINRMKSQLDGNNKEDKIDRYIKRDRCGYLKVFVNNESNYDQIRNAFCSILINLEIPFDKVKMFYDL